MTVDLYKDGAKYGTTTTGASGDYSFTSLPSGNYTVEVSDIYGVLSAYRPTAPGPVQGADNNNQVPQPYAITLPEKVANLTGDFGYYKGPVIKDKSTIGNLLWLDINADGIYQISEPGIGNVSVELWYDTDSDGLVGVGDALVGVEFTTYAVGLASNYAFFDEFPAGDYLVRVTDVNNVLTTYTQTLGPNPTADGNSKAQPYAIVDFNLSGAGNDSDLTADFGYAPPRSEYTITKVVDIPPDDAIAEGTGYAEFTITITNIGETWMTVVPLQDVYDPQYLEYKFADHLPDSAVNGVLEWDDITTNPDNDLAPGESWSVTITFRALKDTTDPYVTTER